MTAPPTLGEIDLLTEADLAELFSTPARPILAVQARAPGRARTRHDPIRFRNLLGRGTLLTAQRGHDRPGGWRDARSSP